MLGNLSRRWSVPAASLAAVLLGPTPCTASESEPTLGRRLTAAAVVVEQHGGFTLVLHAAGDDHAAPTSRNLSENRGGPDAASAGDLQTNRRRRTYLDAVTAAELRYALPAGLLDALVWTESRYRPFVVSRAGAAGLGQLMPGTARDMGVLNRFEPIANIEGAARYLRLLIDKFGAIHLALAAYNASPSSIERAKGIPMNGETPRYVQDVLRRWKF